MLVRLQIAAASALAVLLVLASPAAAIVNGTTTSAASWPWAVQVLLAGGSGIEGFCGGTLIEPRRVVTSGSCVKSASDLYVLADTKELGDTAGGSLSQVTDVQLAPGWAEVSATDVAILTLAEAPDPATPIELLDPSESGDFPSPTSALIAGWGSTTSSGGESMLLRQGQVTLQKNCSGSALICSETTTAPCFGDIGDPVIVQLGTDTVSADPSPANGTWRLVALPVGGAGDCTLALYADLTEPSMRAFVEGPTVIVDPPGGNQQPPPGQGQMPDPVPPPQTKLLKAQIGAGQGSATFKFKAIGKANGFQCALASSRHRKPKFRSCRSPKRYRNLAAGTYTFKVRAVGLGGVDGTPAKKRFTIH